MLPKAPLDAPLATPLVAGEYVHLQLHYMFSKVAKSTYTPQNAHENSYCSTTSSLTPLNPCHSERNQGNGYLIVLILTYLMTSEVQYFYAYESFLLC